MAGALQGVLDAIATAKGNGLDAVIARLVSTPYMELSKEWPAVKGLLLANIGRIPRVPRWKDSAIVLVAIADHLDSLSSREQQAVEMERLVETLGGGRKEWPVEGTVPFFVHVLRDRKYLHEEDLQFSISFTALGPADIYLACRYSGGHWERLKDLRTPADWSLGRVKMLLQGKGTKGRTAVRGEEDREFRTLLVKGGQPRAAELAFASLFAARQKREREWWQELLKRNPPAPSPQPGSPGQFVTTPSRQLQDLNLAAVNSGDAWREDSPGMLPAADFEAIDGRRFDVKCNLYFKSRKQVVGLRGLFIGVPGVRDGDECVQGFVVDDSTDEKCSGFFVGRFLLREFLEWMERRRERLKVEIGARVPPFLLSLPDALRLYPMRGSGAVPLEVPPDVRGVLSNPRLALVWVCATDDLGRAAIRQALEEPLDHIGLGSRVFLIHLSRCLDDGGVKFLEYALWEATTTAMFEVLGGGDPKARERATEFLVELKSVLDCRWLPILLPGAGSTSGEGSLMERWRDQVLAPIVKHWDEFRCPECESREIGVLPERVTAGGAIRGRIGCRACDRNVDATLITHCHKCTRYPLVVGKNQLCPACNGLICRSEGVGGCGACSVHCSRHAGSEKLSEAQS